MSQMATSPGVWVLIMCGRVRRVYSPEDRLSGSKSRGLGFGRGMMRRELGLSSRDCQQTLVTKRLRMIYLSLRVLHLHGHLAQPQKPPSFLRQLLQVSTAMRECSKTSTLTHPQHLIHQPHRVLHPLCPSTATSKSLSTMTTTPLHPNSPLLRPNTSQTVHHE